MKNVSIIVLVCCFSFISKAQTVDPDFFNQTWYLYEVYDSDLNEYFYVEGYQPYGGDPQIDQISPSIFIEDTLEFSGVGICNTVEGILEEDPVEGDFRTISTSVTANSCGFFEDKIEPYLMGPFAAINGDPTLFTIVNPSVTTDSDGFQTMTFGTQPFVGYTYRNTPILSTTDFSKAQIVLYPNPVTNVLNIQTAINNPLLNSLRIFSTAGILISEIQLTPSQKNVDVAFLPNGLYFVEISAENRTETHKLIKE